MDITKMSVTELKALAYDQIVELERVNGNVRAINAEIAKRSKEDTSVKTDIIEGGTSIGEAPEAKTTAYGTIDPGSKVTKTG